MVHMGKRVHRKACGRVDMMRVIPLTKGFVAVISEEDYDKVNAYKWHVHHSRGTKKKHGYPYARATVKGKKVYLHRFLFPELSNEYEVDHINHQTLDCRRENLQIVTPEENKALRRKKK